MSVTTTTLYTKPSCSSCRKALTYLKENNIEFNSISLHNEGITKDELKKILSLTQDGVTDIINRNLINKVEKMSIEEFCDFIIENPTSLKTPIILQEVRTRSEYQPQWKLQIGYQDESLSAFLPRSIKMLLFRASAKAC